MRQVGVGVNLYVFGKVKWVGFAVEFHEKCVKACLLHTTLLSWDYVTV